MASIFNKILQEFTFFSIRLRKDDQLINISAIKRTFLPTPLDIKSFVNKTRPTID